MKKTVAMLVAAGALAGVAQADIIVYTMSGQLRANGGDSAGVSGAIMTMVCHYDDTGVYTDGFGFPKVNAISGTPAMTMSGAPNGANNTTVGFLSDLAFYATFAGTFTDPAGGHTEFITGSGALMQFTANTSPAAGAGDVFIGGPVELDDFAPATYGG